MLKELMDIWDSLLVRRSAYFHNIGLLVARLCIGASMLFAHGLPKWQAYGNLSSQFPDPLGIGSEFSLILAIFAELVCSIFLIFGLATRVALVPLMVTMVVAFFFVHGADPFEKREMAFMYLVTYVTLFFTGPGHISLDGFLYRKYKGEDFYDQFENYD